MDSSGCHCCRCFSPFPPEVGPASGRERRTIAGDLHPLPRPGQVHVGSTAHDDWRDIVDVMQRAALLADADVPVVTDYLAKNFPGKPKPPGDDREVEAVLTEWPLPTRVRGHDPAVAPDGSVCHTGQAGSMLGRFDPATAKFTEYPLRKPSATTRWLPYGVGPHGLVADAGGSIWFTAQLAGYVGKLDQRRAPPWTTRCPTQPPVIRTRRSSIRKGRCGSRCRTAT